MRATSGSAFFNSKRNRKVTARRGKDRDRQSLRLCLENLEQRNLLTSVTFQQGLGGYTSTQDVVLASLTPDVNLGTDTGISVDQQDGNGARQGLLKFGNIIGNGPNQIPAGSTINSATLTVSIFNDSNAEALISMYRMLQDWDQNVATWNSFGSIGGIQASQGEVESLPPDAILFDPSTGVKTFDVTTSLRHWSAGEPNYGWLFESATTNGWDYNTSEAAQPDRPMLTVDYTAPSGAGQFRFLNLTPVHTEKDGGSSVAMLTVARVGGSTGAVSVDYTISAGSTNPALAGTDFVAAGPVTLNFANGVTVQSVPVTINGDVDLEGLETVSVSLTNAQGGATIDGAADDATLTIADDDALINEVLADVSNASDETNREYIELLGTPGASLSGYYFVVFEGEEEENGGAGNGIADLVIDLTGQTFGSNGLLVITPTAWAYTKDAATNQFATAALDGLSGKLEDSSQTYALIRSATPIVQGTDYDTIGAYENGTQTAVGAGLGILDQAPFSTGVAQIVDSVGVLEGGGGNRDRVATLQYPGVHIHQPIGNNSETTPDTLARRLGERAPNSSGPWFNGEVENGNLPAVYAPGAGKRNVVTPAGAQITPGASNILRTVAFAVTAIDVNESAGTAALTVTRLGDSSQAITVNYSTVNGTAIAGPPGTGDFTAVAGGVLSFASGEANDNQTIVITILTDSVAEGFETFGVNLSGATAPYQVITTSATVTINDANVLVKTFQDGQNGYNGTADTYLRSNLPDDVFGSAATVIVDQEVGNLTGVDGRPSHGMIRFDDIFGAAINQVPMGSKIFSAFLTLNVLNPTAGDAQVKLYRMLQSWDEQSATWSNPRGNLAPVPTIINGVTPDDVEATADFDSSLTNPAGSGTSVQVPLNVETMQAWANGAIPNFGWSIVSDSNNDWVFASSDDFLSVVPFFPELTILYTAPTGTGTFQFADDSYKVNENGVSASIVVERVGGGTLASPVSVNWEAALGTALPGDISGPTSGSVIFSGNELTKTITIPIVNDTSLERNETLTISLTTPAAPVPGDFDADFDVDGADFVAWQTNFPKATGAVVADGDADADGDVDGADFVVWQTNFPTTGVGPVVHDTTLLTIRDNDFNASSPTVLLNEFFINSPGNDGGHEFAELAGTPDSAFGSLYLVIFDGDAGFGAGTSDVVVDLGPYVNGSSGLSIVQALNTFVDFRISGGVTQIMTTLLDVENLDNDSASYAIIYSPTTSLSTGPIDYDWDNDGSLELPTGAVFIDSIAIKDNGSLDQTYGPASNIINSATNPNIFVADAVSRLRGNTLRSNAAGWYWGDLFAAGDDPLVYDATNQRFVPVAGAALTPGEINTGTAVQSPLVQLTAITPNAPVGSVTLSFSGPVSQFLKGGGFPGVKITGTTNAPVPGVNINPTVTGLGTNTLTLTFTGASVSGGLLPVGDYRLTFVGNSLIGNGRAVDTNGGAADAVGSNFTFDFNVPAPGSAPESAAFAGSGSASSAVPPESDVSAEPAGSSKTAGASAASNSSATKGAFAGSVAALFASLGNSAGSNISHGVAAWRAASDRVWQSFDKVSTVFDAHEFTPADRGVIRTLVPATIDTVFGEVADELDLTRARLRRGLLAKA